MVALEDRLPADFDEVLESVFAFTDRSFDTPGPSQPDIWSPGDRNWNSQQPDLWPPGSWPTIRATQEVRAGQASVCVWGRHTGLSHAPATVRENDPASVPPQHLTHPNDAQASRHASTDLRHSRTPETPVVRDVVRTHTSPDTSQARKSELASL